MIIAIIASLMDSDMALPVNERNQSIKFLVVDQAGQAYYTEEDLLIPRSLPPQAAIGFQSACLRKAKSATAWLSLHEK
jgi:GAF domain-containing protein